MRCDENQEWLPQKGSGSFQLFLDGNVVATAEVPNATNPNQIILPLITANGLVFFRMVFP